MNLEMKETQLVCFPISSTSICRAINEILISVSVLDCVHTMPAHFENDEKCDGCKI